MNTETHLLITRKRDSVQIETFQTQYSFIFKELKIDL